MDSAEEHAERGWRLYEEDRYSEAVDEYRQAIKYDPDDPELLVRLGRALEHMRDIDGALEAQRKAIQIDPDNRNAYYNLGFLLFYDKYDIDGPIEAWQEALRINPDDKSSMIHLEDALAARAEGSKRQGEDGSE